MSSLPFPKEWPLLRAPSFGIAVSDVTLHCWTRRRALNALPIFGGQTLFVAADAGLWVDSRAVKPHRGKNYEGAKSAPAPTDPPIVRALAINLRVTEETGGPLNDERAIVPPGVALHVVWEADAAPDFAQGGVGEQGNTAAGGWQWLAIDAPTGAVLASGIENVPLVPGGLTYRATIPASALGVTVRCLLFHVAASGVKKPYSWPVDYQTVTGESEFKPQRFLWQHPILGAFHFDPARRVGAYPYDRTDPVQAALIDETERLEALGQLKLRDEWADKLITFNADGTQITAGGEFSALKIQSAGAWCGDTNVAVSACAGVALWTGSEEGQLTPLVVEPRLRRVMDLQEDPDGTFWIAGDIATRSGTRTALLRVDAGWSISLLAMGNPFAGTAVTPEQSRALLGARAGHAIFREKGILHVLTFAGKMRLQQSPAGAKLVRAGVGGRSLSTLVRLDGTQISAYSVDPDQATSPAFSAFGVPKGAGHVVTDSSPYPGAPLAKHYSSSICAKESFWGIVTNLGKESEGASPKAPFQQSEDEPLDDQQGLARFLLGGLEVCAWWPAAKWDMGRVVPWSKGVYAFGFNDKGLPRCHRWTGDGDGLLEMGLELPYLVTWGRSGLTPDGQTETLRIIGRKFFGRNALPGSYAAEGTYGTRGAGGVTAGAGPSTTEFGWSSVSNAFLLSRADMTAQGFTLDSFPPFLQWSSLAAAWIACRAAPVNNGVPIVPYLVFDDSGDPLKFTPGLDVVLPQDVAKWGGLRFTSGTCQGVVSHVVTPPTSCGSMDVALVVDVTGSMGGAIDNVRGELASIVADIQAASNADYRLSLVTFKDTITVVAPFAAGNGDDITQKIGQLTADGGAGVPESSDEAIKTCVLGLSAVGRPQQTGDFAPFRSDARKIIIMVTDAAPGSFSDNFDPAVQGANAHAVAVAAAARNILISAVYVPGYAADVVTDIMEDYADTTGGLFVRTQPNGMGAAAAISDVVNSCGGNVDQTYVQYCTDDLVVPVSSASDAGSVIDTHGGSGIKVGVFRVETAGPMNAVWFCEKSNPDAFAIMCTEEQRLWGRINGTAPVTLNPDGILSSNDLAALHEFNIAVPLGREFWLPRQAHTFELVAIVDNGINVEADLGAVH